ncbi:hypothetical protein MLD38_002418 [Melastoma candidum]|uniref:Uncharacterized protein n=1 Tax=Melastoma candidum TaxID=119954 RepID=A0ACB9RYZ9_9MYRT|nr:hypothetical protein MLD38_002418 [Melastoma candidum]
MDPPPPPLPHRHHHQCLAKAILCFLIGGILISPSSTTAQLLPADARVLLQIPRVLESSPDSLQGWTKYTDFCSLPTSPSLSLLCSEDQRRVSDLSLVGNRTSPLSDAFSLDSFFTLLTKLSGLKSLRLVSLGLHGSLPPKVNRFRSLEVLDLGWNFIGGEIPKSVTTYKSIRSLILANNTFNGSVPDLASLSTLEELNLSNNRLGPEFPSLGNGLVSVVLSNNSFRSAIPTDFGRFSHLQRLDVSSNHLIGHVPTVVFSLPSVQYLNFGKNQFTGILPGSLSCGANLTYVDISSNLLIGTLPRCIVSNSTSNRTVISLWNCLSVGDPKFQHSSSYCQKQEALAVKPPVETHEKKPNFNSGLGIAVIGGIVVIAITAALIIVAIVRRGEARGPVEELQYAKSYVDQPSFLDSPKTNLDLRRAPQAVRLVSLGLPAYQAYTLEEIEDATNSFDPCNLVGEDSQAQIYRGWIRDGTMVLVKCLKLNQRNIPQNQLQHLDMLSKLRHRHLVSIFGHCLVDRPNLASTLFVVLEYVSNGSLHDYMSDWRKKEMLKWPQRITMCLGIARGVQFLHTGVALGIYGNDLKLENVLLDDSLTAKISNYKIPLPYKVASENKAGEGEKEDIYQLGRILLQVITGKTLKTTHELDETRSQLERSLTEHTSQLRSTTDPSIRGTFAYLSMKTAVEVTINCLKKEVSERPSIEDVLWNLQYSIQVQEGWTSSENLSTRT